MRQIRVNLSTAIATDSARRKTTRFSVSLARF
jgi:hypothetical protein